MIVYCVICIEAGGSEVVHIFSTPEKRQHWVLTAETTDEYGYDRYIHYDYEIDNPDRMEKPPAVRQAIN